jgi:Bacterial extracellular solute-binding protein
MNAVSGLLLPLLVALLAVFLGEQTVSAVAQTKPADRLKAIEFIYPQWRGGRNNDAIERGLESVPPADVLADFHGSLDHPELVLYASGNYFFALGPLVKVFGEAHPQYSGRVFYETLPPGLLLKQMGAGGTVTSGNMTWTAKPDVFMAELTASDDLVRRGKLAAPAVAFATPRNSLTTAVQNSM